MLGINQHRGEEFLLRVSNEIIFAGGGIDREIQ